MEYTDEADWLARLDPEGDDVLDFEVDRIPDLDAVAEPLLLHLDGRALDPEHLTDERADTLHRTTLLTAEDGAQLLHLLVRSTLVDEQPEAPVPLGHHLRGIGDHGDREATDIGALDLTLLDVEDQRDAAEIVRRSV